MLSRSFKLQSFYKKVIFLIILIFIPSYGYSLAFDASLNTGVFEYRGITERNGYILGLNTGIFLMSDIAITLSENISFLDKGSYREKKYADSSSLLNSSLGIMFIVDRMTLMPYIKICGELYKGNILNDINYDYGYSLGAGLRYEKSFYTITIELSYKQLYKTTTEFPSIILFTIGGGVTSEREKEKESIF